MLDSNTIWVYLIHGVPSMEVKSNYKSIEAHCFLCTRKGNFKDFLRYHKPQASTRVLSGRIPQWMVTILGDVCQSWPTLTLVFANHHGYPPYTGV